MMLTRDGGNYLGLRRKCPLVLLVSKNDRPHYRPEFSLILPCLILTGPRDNTAATALRTTFAPSLDALTLTPSARKLPQSPLKPITLPVGAPPEIQVGQLDLGGNWFSRAKKTERFNQRKEEEKKYGKKVMKEEKLARSMSKKGAFEDQVLL